jgi:hypothetical protein
VTLLKIAEQVVGKVPIARDKTARGPRGQESPWSRLPVGAHCA